MFRTEMNLSAALNSVFRPVRDRPVLCRVLFLSFAVPGGFLGRSGGGGAGGRRRHVRRGMRGGGGGGSGGGE